MERPASADDDDHERRCFALRTGRGVAAVAISPMKPLELPARPRILVVALRRLGDVLFTTPLIAAMRGAWPDATIDALVFDDTAGILAGNPDLDRVVAMPARRSFGDGVALALRLFKRYDLAISTQSGDRPTAFALIAGRRNIGPVDPGGRGALRRLALTRSLAPQPGLHRLEETLRIADVLGIGRVGRLVCPRSADSPYPPERAAEGLEPTPYAVVHAAPMFVYKRWTRDGWRALAEELRNRGLTVIATGGPAAAERSLLDDLWSGMPEITRVDGRLSWPQLASLLAGAQVYVGPDTAVTHLAAASGCPTVALFGPTDPRLWGPVPATGLDPMWAAAGTIQHRGNVWLVQNPLPCLPCQLEGCERRLDSHSQCLDELTAAQVISAVDQALALRQAA
jgi:heptosyltransferase-3